MGLFGPPAVELRHPNPMEMYLPDFSLIKKKKHLEAITSLKATVEQVLVDHKSAYASGAGEIVGAVGSRARLAMGMEPHDIADLGENTQAEYLTAAAFGLAAGQTEVALSMAPGPGKTHAYMNMVLTMGSMNFEDVLCGYLIRAGHYIGRNNGRGVDQLAIGLG